MTIWAKLKAWYFFTWIFEFVKGHIFWEGHKNLSYVLPVKIKIEISQNFVAFSEYMNFTSLAFACNLVWHDIFNSLGIFEQSIIHRYRLCALVKKKHCHWRIQRILSGNLKYGFYKLSLYSKILRSQFLKSWVYRA
jgi:hypothetical protein